MVRRDLKIPVSLINPVVPGNVSKFKKQLKGIQQTQKFKLNKNTLPKTYVKNPIQKGVLAKVADPKVASGMVTITMVDFVKAAGWIARGEQGHSDLIRITPGNNATPAHLPDMSDLATHPMVFKVFIAWFINKFGGFDGLGSEHIIPNSIKGIIDPSPRLPPVMEMCWLCKGEHSIELQSYKNDLKLFNVEAPNSVSKLSIAWSPNSINTLDGRIAKVKVGVTNPDIVDLRYNNTEYLLWNCRDMAREEFCPLMSTAIELHMPDVVILTETRVSVHMARLIMKTLMPYRVCGVSKSIDVGGALIITFRREVLIKQERSTNKSVTWAMETIA